MVEENSRFCLVYRPIRVKLAIRNGMQRKLVKMEQMEQVSRQIQPTSLARIPTNVPGHV